MSSFDSRFERLIERLQAKYREITEYRSNLNWRFFQGTAPDAYRAGFDDSAWKSIDLPLLIDARGGESWLRCTVTIPDEVASIEVSGSTAKLSSSIMLGSSEMYVNSQRVMTAEYWTELRGPRIQLNEKVKPGEEYVVAFHILPYHEPINV
ncbi:MAG: hypothetical protein ACE5NN_07240, partial [Candidatus Bathyarchaeia archaeon]